MRKLVSASSREVVARTRNHRYVTERKPLCEDLTIFLILIFLSVSMFLCVPDTVAEYAAHMQWNLPENAKARLGKGGLSGDIAYSPDGTLFAVVSFIGIWLYDAETGEEQAVFIADENDVAGIAFSPDGAKLAIALFKHNFVQLWDVETGLIETTFLGYGGGTTCVAFSPDGAKLICGSWGGTVQLWDVSTREIIETLIIGDNGEAYTEGTRAVTTVSFSPDGTLLAVGSNDGTVQLWDVGTREPTTTLQRDRSIMSVVFNPDGNILAVGSEDGKVSLWDMRKGVLKSDFVAHQRVSSLAFSPDGKTLASGGSRFISDKDRVRLWDVASGELKSNLIGHTDDVDSIVFSPDGTTLVSSSRAGNIVRFFDVASGELKFNLTGYFSSIDNIIFSPDGQTLVSSSGTEGQDATVQLWDVGTGTPKVHLSACKQIVYNASVPGGVPLVGCFNSETGLELYDVVTGDLKTTFSESEWVLSVALSPDSKILATASGLGDSTVRLWDVETGTLTTGLWHKEVVNGVVFSPDNTKLAIRSWDGNVVYLWDSNTHQPIGTLKQRTRLVSMVFSPDGRTLVCSSVNSMVYLWDVGTRELIRTLQQDNSSIHDDSIISVAFSPDGRTLACGTDYNGISLWNVESGTLKSTFVGQGYVKSVVFSPDGSLLASGSNDGTILFWELVPEFGKQTPLPADVNEDGAVNIQD